MATVNAGKSLAERIRLLKSKKVTVTLTSGKEVTGELVQVGDDYLTVGGSTVKDHIIPHSAVGVIRDDE